MFEDFKENLRFLEQEDSVPVEVLLDSMFRLIREANISDEPVANVESYAKGLINLFTRIKPSYLLVRDQLRQMDNDYLQTVLLSCEEAERTLEKYKSSLDEHKNALAALQNAWRSMQLRDELSLALGSMEEFRGVPSEIRDFAGLERWFDRMGAGIEQALAAYAEMYQKMLDSLNPAGDGR